MSKNKVLDTALSIIDEHIRLDHNEIARKIYGETGYNIQDFNKFIAVTTSGTLSLGEYIRIRKLFFAANDLVNIPDKTIADISLEYGYSDQTSFSRAIKKEYKQTPGNIRKNKSEIPDIRKELKSFLSNKSRLDSIFDKLESNYISNTDWHYFEDFIHATDELGFDTSTCCLISELSEKLSIPFGCLIKQCFEMTIECNQANEDEMIEFMMELEIESSDELKALCQYYNCKWYDLTFVQVKMYQLEVDSEKELDQIWKYYNCRWELGEPYPLTQQMVQDYRNKHHEPK